MQPHYWAIEQLPGLSQQQQEQLKACGIATTEQLLRLASTPTARQLLAGQLQIHIQYVNKWVALSDLARIPSVGTRYCGLLLHSGVVSVAQLAKTPIPNLHEQILRLHVATMQRKDLCPPVEVVKQWVTEARSL
ncbi:DUF4332 domain-containing protein [Candidatus Gracilibacteria bacterium]|jgi:Domain of unknown function (DUF4332)|nr:DUF4332 domain-containing protein [Candidatus Gracilibacteria bacterium]NJM87191.1 DUF4332 domain-containing protein [Hydrococcus sp. RU_2_2]NJP20301.1 DUF4332 domain-containing protein [Hydrococcus sp. CRU_1_1]